MTYVRHAFNTCNLSMYVCVDICMRVHMCIYMCVSTWMGRGEWDSVLISTLQGSHDTNQLAEVQTL